MHFSLQALHQLANAAKPTRTRNCSPYSARTGSSDGAASTIQLIARPDRKMRGLLLAFPAFVIAVFGVALAIIWFSLGWTQAASIAVAIALFGWVIDYVARHLVIMRHPSIAVWMMELWVLCPGAFAAIAAALLIVLNVHLKPETGSGLTGEQKELLSAVLTALTALITASFIKAADDADTNWIAPHVQKAFYNKFKPIVVGEPQERFTRYFRPNHSELERWVYRGTYGGAASWNFSDRHLRARGISRAMKNGDRPDPNRH
jgi:hypothetical protein